MTRSYPHCPSWSLFSIETCYDNSLASCLDYQAARLRLTTTRSFVRIALVNESIRMLLSTSLRAWLLQQAHQSTSGRDTAEWKMYYSLRRYYYWPRVDTDVCNTVKDCSQCPRVGTEFKHVRQLEHFSPAGLFEFVAMDILWQQQNNETEKQFVVVITNGYKKLTRAIPTVKFKLTQVTHTFCNDPVIPYSIPDILLPYNS